MVSKESSLALKHTTISQTLHDFMYAIYAYIDPQNRPNVGIYGTHGVSGYVVFVSGFGADAG